MKNKHTLDQFLSSLLRVNTISYQILDIVSTVFNELKFLNEKYCVRVICTLYFKWKQSRFYENSRFRPNFVTE